MQTRTSLEEIVGKSNVLDDPAVLDGYSSDLSFVPKVRPKWVVKPGSAVEVQEVIKWANATSTPLVPVSSGTPRFRGDTIPRTGGAIILDMSRMKRIITISERNGVAIVEPGVTFADLQPELEKAGLSAYMPLCPKSSKSVVASMLEREPATMPAQMFDSTDPFCCAEIIYGTGDKLRGGEACGPDTTVEEMQEVGNFAMVPFGLGQFEENKLISAAQGTMGIVTWASLRCRKASKFSRTYLVPSEDILPLLDVSYQLLRIRQSDHLFIINDLNLASLLAKDQSEIKALRETLPPWVLVVSFEGNGDLPEDKVAWQESDFKEIVARCGTLKPATVIPGANGDELSQILSRPSGDIYWKQKYKGGFDELFFVTTLDKTPDFISAISGLAQSKRYPVTDIGVYIQPRVQGTSCHCEFDFYYDPSNAAEADRVKWLVTDGSANLAQMGAFFSRPYGYWAKVAYSRASETAAMQKKLKNIFDPNNVLNPGQLCF